MAVAIGGRIVIGVGNEFRRDDGVGPRVVAELTGDLAGAELRVTDGEPGRLLDLWAGVALAVVVDAVHAPDHPPGTWFEVCADAPEPPATGTHGAGLGTAVALGRALGRLPHRLVVLAVCGSEFGFGAGLSAPVEAAIAPVAARVRQLVVPD
jgi:hydrogenase maturation protease